MRDDGTVRLGHHQGSRFLCEKRMGLTMLSKAWLLARRLVKRGIRARPAIEFCLLLKIGE